jgi:hypothetical protein
MAAFKLTPEQHRAIAQRMRDDGDMNRAEQREILANAIENRNRQQRTNLDPRHWKKEHQVALACAVAFGAVVGLIFGVQLTEDYTGFRWGALYCPNGNWSCSYLLTGYRLRIMEWMTVGGIVGAVLVYIRQLLKA